MAVDPGSEKWMTELLSHLLSRRKGTFIDVGMNLGQTLLKVRAIDPNRPYVGFEPNPTCVSYLEELVRVNQLDNVTVVPAGLASKTEILMLHHTPGSDYDSGASIIPDFRPVQTSSKLVPVFAAADLPAQTFPAEISIVKIDVEGAELTVVQSLQDILAATKPAVVMEILPARNQGRLERQTELLTEMTRLGYALFRIRHVPNGALDRLDPLTAIEQHTDLRLTNYLFLQPGEEGGLNLHAPRS